MALDNRAIVITLKLDSQSDEQNNNPTNTTQTKQSTDKDSKAKAVAVFAATQVIETIASEVVAWAEYNWDRTLKLNDDYVGQRNKNIAITQINKAVGAISTIGSMTAAGASIGGAAGAIVGAILGTATTVAGIARSNLQGQDQQDIALRQMNAQLQFTRSRAGWSTQAASIGEDL